MALPPGPPLPALVQTLAYMARPVDFLLGCARRYGDCFTINTLAFGLEVCVTRPDDIKRVFQGDPDVLRAGEANAPLEPLLGPRSVLLLDGPEHLRQRRLLMPPLHGERMTAYAQTMTSITERAIARWPLARSFALHPHMQGITLDIILRTVFGVEDAAHLDDLREALSQILDRQASLFMALATMPAARVDLFGLSPWAHFRRGVARADELIHREIRARRAELASGKTSRGDILSLLIEARDEDGSAMTDAELRDELVTLLMAGHETTATQLCWAFDFILHEPRVLARLQRELDEARGDDPDGPSAAALQRLPYLDATIKEVLRLCPVVPAVGRRLKAPMEMRGYTLPAGTLLVPAVFLTHRRPDVYPDPEALRPERFLDNKPDPYAWLPFGGGVRRCVGMAFALFEMKVVLGTVLSRVELVASKPERERVSLRGFTHAPASGAEVVMRSKVRAARRPTTAQRAIEAPLT